MAKTAFDRDVFKALRTGELRNRIAREITDAGDKAPEVVRRTVRDLRKLADQLEDQVRGGPAKRSEAARKAARTRKRQSTARSAAAKRGARTRAAS